MPHLLIASPHRYPDLARLWHRFVVRELVPALERLGLTVDVNIFCDANAEHFFPGRFPGVRFSHSGPGMRDFMEFYDATLHEPCDFLLFLDADTFLLDGSWASSYFEAFADPAVAAISFVPRKGAPAIFALLCRVESYRGLPAPALACRYEFPADWPHGINLQPGDFAAREFARSGMRVVNVGEDESARHVVNFRGTTGLRATREHMTRAAGESVFFQFVAENPALLVAAYDNVVLGCLYEAIYREPFAVDSAGGRLGGSLTIGELRSALDGIRERTEVELLGERFWKSRESILRLADLEGVELAIPPVLPDGRNQDESS